MRPIELYKHQLAVLPKPADRKWSSIGWSDAPYALCILPAECHGNVPENYTNLAVWGLPEEMSVEDAWGDFEPAGEYVIIDNTPTGENMKLITLEHETGVSWEVDVECFETPDELKRYLEMYAKDGTYTFYGNTIYATASAIDAAVEGYEREVPALDIITSSAVINTCIFNIQNITLTMSNNDKTMISEIIRELRIIADENTKILKNANTIINAMRN